MQLRAWTIAALAALLTACGVQEPVRQEGYVFGTRVEIVIADGKDGIAKKAVEDVMREFDRLHNAYHAWKKSELTALNAALAAGKPKPVPPELGELIREAQDLAEAGNHLFDPGIGRLIALWGFQTDEIKPSRPSDEAIKEVLDDDPPSIASLVIENNVVRSSQRNVALDFGGYLKGVALDRAAEILRDNGLRHALINIGGNVLAMGNRQGRPDGKPWRVGIQHPRSAEVGNLPLAALELQDGEAIGTSGDYHRFFEVDGKRYCHLIDPRTGQPHADTRSLTILVPAGSDVGMRSDALSKPIFIAGKDWRAMARKLGVASVLRVGADGAIQATRPMRERLRIELPDLKIETVD